MEKVIVKVEPGFYTQKYPAVTGYIHGYVQGSVHVKAIVIFGNKLVEVPIHLLIVLK